MPHPIHLAPADPRAPTMSQGPIDRRTPTARRRATRPAKRTAAIGVLALLWAPLACSDGPTGPQLEGEVAAFVELLNDHRISVGCQPLAWNGQVAAVAEAHSQDMLDRDFFAHTNPDGVTASGRLQAAGISYQGMAENIAWGFPTGAAVLEGWLNSSGHRANIENCTLEQHGVGLVGTHWTHVFTRP